MKKLLAILFFIASVPLLGQDWKPSFSDALKTAKEENKPLILVFTGSDWCAPCIKLDKKIWKSEAFRNYSAEHYVLYKADFPRKKSNKLEAALTAENQKLTEKYNPNGFFPLVVVLDNSQNVLGVTGYKNIAPADYIALLNGFLK
ncbi:thioredoxin family protein [Flagellimonas lutaonensis]|uniref:Putative thioredoxin disulfide isomerase n=1 Tax=Flagellimonas lutaonensis TaxID=516051 RepID=A0A0D5YQI9_9FLAO|nr:thioredoxin family protein [Allomuricauda lutaonensis]AKA34194.1 Putative thioredoxin disulfide isomerase [Allomuricauda lutaonensis]